METFNEGNGENDDVDGSLRNRSSLHSWSQQYRAIRESWSNPTTTTSPERRQHRPAPSSPPTDPTSTSPYDTIDAKHDRDDDDDDGDDDDDPASIIASINSNTSSLSSAASSRIVGINAVITGVQRSAMEEYIESPSPAKWRILVQSMADEKRRKKKEEKKKRNNRRSRRKKAASSSSSSISSPGSRRRSRRRRSSSAAAASKNDGEDTQAQQRDDGAGPFPSSVEIPTPPRSASRCGVPLAMIDEDDALSAGDDEDDGDDARFSSSVEIPTPPRGVAARELVLPAATDQDGASTPMDAGTAARGCDELRRLISFSDEEDIYEEGSDSCDDDEDDAEVEELTRHSRWVESDDDDDDAKEEEVEYPFRHRDFRLFPIDEERGNDANAMMELLKENEIPTKAEDTIDPFDVSNALGAEEEEVEYPPRYRDFRLVPFDEERGDDATTIKMQLFEEEEHEIPSMTVEDIIADLDDLMTTESSNDASGSTGLTTDAAATQRSRVSAARFASCGGETLAAAPPATTAGPSPTGAPAVHGDRERTSSNARDGGATPLQNSDKDARRRRGYVLLGLLACVAAALTIGISLGSGGGGNDGNGDGELNLKLAPASSSLGPSASFAPSWAPSLRPSAPPSSSSPPSSVLSSLPWKQLGEAMVGEAPDDWSGWSAAVSSDGTILAVGAPGPFSDADGGSAGSRPGYVRVYVREVLPWEEGGSEWRPLGAALKGEVNGDMFGRSVALSSDGTILAVGAPGHPDRADRPGYAMVYSLEEGSGGGVAAEWTPLLAAVGDVDGEMTGASVALSADGRTLAVGAPGAAGGDSPGRVRVYRWGRADDGSGRPRWTRRGGDVEGDSAGDGAGASVDLSGDGGTMAVGAPFDDNGNNGRDAGRVRVYRYAEEEGAGDKESPGWKRLGNDVDGDAPGDRSGRSVSLSEDGLILAVGANGDDGNGRAAAGRARVLRLSTGDDEDEDEGAARWERIGRDVVGEAAGDQSGVHVALSADGRTLAVGANGHDGKNGSSAGRVRAYRYLAEEEEEGDGEDGPGDDAEARWVRRGQGVDGEAAGDNSGFCVALSANGEVLVVGSPWHSGANGDRSGHVRVFEMEQ